MDALLGLIGASPAIDALRGAIRKLSAHGAAAGARLPTVLITGETGTGKGLVANLIHRVSPRAEGPFVDVNCAAIPETLLEAELFGYERGAFTDAHRSKPGLLQMAHGGTIFLDEVGLLSPPLQAKLLKVTEERAVRRLGGTRSEPITARLISATNADLAAAKRDRRFREDLYHRLAVVTLELPPLRSRDQDVVLLAEHFLARACHDYGLPARVLSPDARRRLVAYSWPGNVRELANVMERTALLAESTYVTAKELDLPAVAAGPTATAAPIPVAGRSQPSDTASLDGATRAHVQAVLEECGGNITRSALALGITRTTLRAHIRKFGLEVGPTRTSPLPRSRPAAARSAQPAAEAPAPVADAIDAMAPEAPAASANPALASAAAPSPAAAAAAAPAATALAPLVTGGPVALRWELGLVGLLSISLGASPETSDYQLASLVQELIATATSFGGRVEELAPLGLVVAFGIDRLEDGPRRAAYAALAAGKAVERRQPALPSVEIRCAIDVSRCLVAQGSASGMDMAAKRAACASLDELLGAAGAGAVLVTARAVPHLERRFELASGPAAAFALVGRERTGLEVGGRTLSRFVGREADLAALCDRLAEAEAGRGQVVGIVGEPGVGKSRLLYELRRSLPTERVRFVSGRCLPHGRTSPYMPIAGLVRETFGVDEDADVESARERLVTGLAAIGLPAEPTVPYLLPLLGLKQAADALAGQSPAAIRSRTIDAVKQVCVAASRRQPVVWAVEDLHWIDRSSEDVLDAIATELADSAVLLVATYRPGHRPTWSARPHASELPLGRLTSDESLAVLESVLPDAPAALGERIVARADGVPLFIEELARALSERTGDAAALAVPDTLQGVLTARLDHLAPDDRELLQVASVIGRDVPLRVLAEVAERPAGRLEDALARLRAAEFIHEVDAGGAGGAQVYRFKHSLTQEVTYQSLRDQGRRRIHAAVARAIERVAPDTGERQPELLAHHLTEAGLPSDALGYWQVAGTRARARAAYAEAAQQLTQGLALIPALPEAPERDQRELALQVSLGICHSALSGFAAPEVRRIHERARELCRRVEAGALLLGALGGLCQFYYFRAEFDAARDMAEQHLAAVQATGELNRLCASYDALGYIAYHVGDLLTARAHLEKSLDLYDTIPRPPGTSLVPFDIGVSAQAGLALALCVIGEGRQAVHHGRLAVERAARLAPQAESFSLAYAHTCLSRVHLLRREPEPAAEHARQAIEIGRAHGYATPMLEGQLGLALARIAAGEAAAGAAQLGREIEAWGAGGYELDLPYWLAGLAEGYRGLGDLDTAEATLETAIVHMDRQRGHVWAAELYRLRAELMLLRSPSQAERAAAALEHALGVARAQGARLFELRAATSLHRLRRDQGRAGESRAVLAMVLRGVQRETDPVAVQEAEALLDDAP